MKDQLTLLIFMFLVFRSEESASFCPPLNTFECSCSNRMDDGHTFVVCHGIRSTSHLEEATKPLKSLLIDRLLLINVFSEYNATLDESVNVVEPKGKTPITPLSGILPKKWLAELRVRDLEVQNGNFNGFFLSDDAFEGQADFLTGLVVKNAGLKGHLCASCAPNFSSVSTKGLRRTPLLQYVDFSHNQLEVLDGTVFPSTLKLLSRITLSNNQINRINDNAFASLHHLNHVDLSRNRLSAFNRKIFRTFDTMLETLDLSYNAIQTLPEEMFQGLNALKELQLSHNLLETLTLPVWSKLPPVIEHVDVRGNFLVCNCSMSWLSRRMSKNTKLIGYCTSPKSVEYNELLTLTTLLSSCS